MTDRLDSFLSDAADAARTRSNHNADDGAATRLRLRESIANRPTAHRRSRRKLTFIAGVIASLFGSVAFAAYVGGWRPLSSDEPPAPAPVVAVDSPAKVKTKAKGHRARESAAAEEPAPVKPVEESAPVAPVAPVEPYVASKMATTVEPPRAAASKPAPRVEPQPAAASKPAPLVEPQAATASKPAPRVEPPPAAASKPAPRVEPPTPSKPAAPRVEPQPSSAPRIEPVPSTTTAPSGELAAYRIAHEAHFRGTDPAAALAAWDVYLARFPNGQLVPEARYDRALVLVKLERYADARAALAPFANAPAGSYRQAEAAKVLAALPK